MSWNNDPFRNYHMHRNKNGHLTWHCDSCGWDSEEFTHYDLITDAQQIWFMHLYHSHGYKNQIDTEHMSEY